MTTEQLKELYPTGEWICVSKTNHSNGKLWSISNYPAWSQKHVIRKLIHKRHSEVLDHVLNGGSVIIKAVRAVFDKNNFFDSYDSNCNYEIIKDKPSLNGHYCLATKEHYDKLRDDGYKPYSETTGSKKEKYFVITASNFIMNLSFNSPTEKPMHLHNNEWVFGSLEHMVDVTWEQEIITKDGVVNYGWVQPMPVEHEVDYSDGKKRVCAFLREAGEWNKKQSKPVERITREEALNKLSGIEFISETSWLISELFDYIEYLEANQKEE